MSVVGIDFGTTNTCVAVAYQKKISVVPNTMSKWTTPSLIAFGSSERVFGGNAESQWARNYKNTIPQIKRFFGRELGEKEKKEISDWIVAPVSELDEKQNDHRIAFDVTTSQGKKKLLPEQILPGFLEELKKFTRKFLNGIPVGDCVVSCPYFFDDAQRRALLTACRLSDLKVLRLMNETTAIALNYGILRQLPEKETRRVMFIDVGYSNTQVSVVDFIKGKLTMHYQSFNPYVGTRNFDQVLYDNFVRQWNSKHKNLNINDYPKARVRLQNECVKIKKLLSGNKDAEWCLECFIEDYDFNVKITREELEKESENIYKEICKPIIDVLEHCKSNFENEKVILHSCEIVGGGSYIPSVKTQILDCINKYKDDLKFDIPQLSKTLNGDETVARGCAIMCAMLSPNFKVKQFEVNDINNVPVFIDYPSTDDTNKRVEKMVIRKGDPSPCTSKISLSKTNNFDINIGYPGCKLGHFNIDLLPVLPNGTKEPEVKLHLKLNRHALLNPPEAELIEQYEKEEKVEVKQDTKEEDTKMDVDKEPKSEPEKKYKMVSKKKKSVRKLKVTGQYLNEITKQVFDDYYALEGQFLSTDQLIRERDEARNNLESFIYDTRDKLDESYKDFIQENDCNLLKDKLERYDDWLVDEADDATKSQFNAKLNELQEIVKPIAMRKYEFDNRDFKISELRKLMVKYWDFADSKDAKFDHIEQTKKDEIKQRIKQMESKLNELITQQNSLAKHEDPAIKLGDLDGMGRDLIGFADPIMNTVKPKEPTPDCKKEDDVKTDNEAKEDEDCNMKDAQKKSKVNMDEVDVDKNMYEQPATSV